jgi:NAD(P)-dependent dehydrogenase (short-subunit alcohol dehydrogenase family)
MEEIEKALRLLEALVEDRGRLADIPEELRNQLLLAAGRLSRPARHERKQFNRTLRRQELQARRAHDARLVANTLNRETRRSSEIRGPADLLPGSTATNRAVVSTETQELLEPRSCYICKNDYRKLHHFYDSLCPDCAELNYQKRFQTARLDGKTALVTGARIKIGYQASLMLLRAGAQVLATSRFPVDAAERYAREPDFAEWSGRLHIHGLDLVHTPSVEKFARHLVETLPRLDFLVNNAAQTVSRPPQFYRHLIEKQLPGHISPALVTMDQPRALAHVEDPMFPRGVFDRDEQQLDLRPMNSWRMTLADVPAVELLEVHLVNAIAPCLLVSRLKPLMKHAAHIINVSAMEAQFARNKKTDRHPHTNMAKAALNMMTRTSAVDYVQSGIFMNSVDTGWVTDEDPLHHVARKQEVHDFHPPLDAIDGAARILDPIFVGYNTGEHPWGHFFKDYKSVKW